MINHFQTLISHCHLRPYIMGDALDDAGQGCPLFHGLPLEIPNYDSRYGQLTNQTPGSANPNTGRPSSYPDLRGHPQSMVGLSLTPPGCCQG